MAKANRNKSGSAAKKPTLSPETPLSLEPVTQRWSARNKGKQVDYSVFHTGDETPQTVKTTDTTVLTPFTPFTPVTQVPNTTSTPLSSPPQLYSTPPCSPTKGDLSGTPDTIAKFLSSFPEGYERENVSGQGLLCGPRAVSRSVQLQFGSPAPTVDELRAIAMSPEMKELEFLMTMGEGVRSLENDFSADQLAAILRRWGRLHERDLVLGWLMHSGRVNIFDDDDTTAATGIVWIYTSNDGQATADAYTDHYEALGRPTPSDLPNVKTSSSSARKRPAANVAAAAPIPERFAKRQRLEDDSDYDPSSSRESNVSDDEDFSLFDQVFLGLDDELSPENEEGDVEFPATVIPPAATLDPEGLLRIGMQPRAAHAHDILSAPQEVVSLRIKEAVYTNTFRQDKQSFGLTKERMTQLTEEVASHLVRTMTRVEEEPEYLKRYCDYTGSELSWIHGPVNASIEAVHPLAISDGRIGYHANPNVVIAIAFLNLLKKSHPVLVLPTISSFLNAKNKAQKDWALIAADNLSCLVALFHLQVPHKKQADIWSSWDNNRLKEMLKTLQTGTLTAKQREQIARRGVRDLFSIAPIRTGARIRNVSPIRDNMNKIAAKYDISLDEFDQLCFIDSSSGSRVFYPFWHRSRDLAREFGWSWRSVFQFATERLCRLRSRCNRNAEKAGFGEEAMDADRVVYWMTHWICLKIKVIKECHTQQIRTTDDIAWLLLDRWGLPVVPWRHHIFSASVCKYQDHGIAMYFGLVSRPGEAFDPVNDFDLTKCTITIDSFATNFGMGFWNTESWPDILAILRTIPVQSPLWRPDESLGMSVWASGRNTLITGIRPQPPVPTFTMPLIDIDLWTSGDKVDISFQCEICRQKVDSIGEWIHHCRQKHATHPISDSEQESTRKPGPDQQGIDKAYWDAYIAKLTCPEPGCGKEFKRKGDLIQHRLSHMSDRPFKCPDCDDAFKTQIALNKHLVVHSLDRPFECTEPGCHKKFKNIEGLRSHLPVHNKTIPCTYPDCNKLFQDKTAFEAHLLRHNKTVPCTNPGCDTLCADKKALKLHLKVCGVDKTLLCTAGCDKVFKDKTALRNHLKLCGVDKTIPCTEPGCYKKFKNKEALRSHLPVHNKTVPCTYPGCNKLFQDKTALKSHLTVHSKTLSCTNPGCDKIFTDKQTLKEHLHVCGVDNLLPCTTPGCDKVFKDKTGLRNHLLVHNKTFACTEPGCDKMFARKNELTQHLAMSHSDDRPFACLEPGCGKTYKIKTHLSSHTKSKHSSESLSKSSEPK